MFDQVITISRFDFKLCDELMLWINNLLISKEKLKYFPAHFQLIAQISRKSPIQFLTIPGIYIWSNNPGFFCNSCRQFDQQRIVRIQSTGYLLERHRITSYSLHRCAKMTIEWRTKEPCTILKNYFWYFYIKCLFMCWFHK